MEGLETFLISSVNGARTRDCIGFYCDRIGNTFLANKGKVLTMLRIDVKGEKHCNGLESKGTFGISFQPNSASKSMYCLV